MGDYDIAQMKFFRDTRHFADIWNGLAFNGRQVLKWDELKEINPVGLAGSNGRKIKKTADMIMAQTQSGEVLAIMLTENQMTVDYSLAVRVNLREAMEYDRQVAEIVKRNKKEKRVGNSGEYLYSFTKEDRLKPVATLILYWNSENWDGAQSLSDMTDFTGNEDIRGLVSDFKLNIVNMSEITHEEELFKDHEVLDVISLYLRRNDKRKFKEYVDEYGKRINLDSMELISVMVASNELKGYVEENASTERSNNQMCKAITELLQDSRNEGKFEAEYTCFKNCLDRGKSYEEAQILSGASDENAEKYHQKWLKENKRN